MTFDTYKETPGRQPATLLELDLDFCTRSYGVSPCAATLALRNDLNWSQEFDQTTAGPTPGWFGGVTADAINAPDGTLTADEWVRTVATPFQFENLQDRTIGLSVEPSNTAHAYRMCVKPKLVGGVVSERYFGIGHFTSGTLMAYAWFDLETGASMGVGGSSTVFHHYIRYMEESSEDDWYEVGFIFDSDVPPGTAQIGFFITDASFNVSTAGDIGDGVYIWGAQVRPIGPIGQASLFTGPFVYGKYAVRTTAVVDGMGDPGLDLCFNTFATCQDTANFNRETRTLKFIDTLQRPPNFLEFYPCIKSVTYAPTVLKPGGNLSIRGQVTLQLQDFATTDNDIDDYAHNRGYNAEDQGTFFGKLKARQLYYIGRPMRVKEGYLDGASELDFRTREYIIDDISGPTADGKVTITGKDILSLAADVRAKAPTASTGTLLGGITAVQTTATLAVGTGSQYANGDNIRINDEIISITTIVGDSITAMVRAQGGTTAAAHNSGDNVQLCLTYTDEPLIDVIDDLLQTYANVPASFIPYTDWEAEETESLAGYLMTTIISEPTGVLTLLKELAEITLIDLWYDDTDQEIKLKLQTPFTEVTEEVNDNEHILQNSLKVKDLNKDRLTRVLIYYGIRNFARDLKETENYSLVQFDIDADKEGVNKYADERIKRIMSRWFDSSNITQVQLTAQRLLDRFGITPKQIMFDMDAKDVGRIKTGDVFDLTSRIEQDLDGTDATNRYQVTEEKTKKSGSIYSYKAEAFFQDPTPDSLTIAANDTNYDIFVELGGPPGPVDVTLTINAAVRVHGTNGNPAIKTDGMHPDSTLTIINNGEIYGHGGDGGNGRNANIFGEANGGPCFYNGNVSGGSQGQAGGDAIRVTVASVDIDNTNGEIFGGGGGGGGGDGWVSSGSCTSSGGGGGGGGQGEDTAALGSGGNASAFCSPFGCGPEVDVDGSDGTAGSVGSAGTGGAAAGTGAGAGGDGGDWGDAGVVGASTGFAGGDGGYAVRLNGASIMWQGGNTPAKVKGQVA